MDKDELDDLDIIKLKLDALSETTIKLASNITSMNNLTLCPYCHEQVMHTMRCPYCLGLLPDHKRIIPWR